MKLRHLALALSATVVLAACGDDGENVDAADTVSTTAPAETTTTMAAPATSAPVTSDGTSSVPAAAATGIEGPDAEAAAAAVATVFDSSLPFDRKVTALEGGEAHRGDHDAYLSAAEQVGGITVRPTAVSVDGDTAVVTYAVSFAGNQVYEGLTMDAMRTEGTWVVPTSAFCDFLAAARTACGA